ncbi:hypothetical protein [Chromobacterium haemolyticum]|uniref:hypothetical protein n=1 Tax=Chromobacterium haemolyticum TaxID=394935 RepID=UPI001F5DA0B6|nr:hypothetical protein [Chromobacterium haemolyticum]
MAKPLSGLAKMAKPKKSVADDVQIVTMRLDKETALYYRRRANERGVSLSDFLRNMIVQGMIAETALDVEQRMRALIAEMQISAGGGGSAKLPENALLSIYTSEQLLTKIVEARNVQDLYEAQDKAKARLKREKGEANG